MKGKFVILGIALVLVLLLGLIAAPVMADKPDGCTTIKDGTLIDKYGNELVLGYDQFGYNYQAHQFNGRYCDYDRVIGGAYCDVTLVMKWSDTWLSNKDCPGDGETDGLLDRGGPGGTSSAAEGAWVTNHQRGIDENGEWTYFVKIVYPPGGVVDVVEPFGIDDNTGGEIIWGSYIVLQRVSSGEGATNYTQPVGFGAYK